MDTTLKNITASGDVAGRDIVNNILPKPSQMDILNKKYLEEIVGGVVTSSFMDELNHYKNKKSDVRCLREKLEDSGYGSLVSEGEELKELISKLIIKNQNYKSAQMILTLLLSEIESIFNSEIKHRILTGVTEMELKAIVREKVELKISDSLGENVLEIFNRQINGMIFFLTGNCHLEWK